MNFLSIFICSRKQTVKWSTHLAYAFKTATQTLRSFDQSKTDTAWERTQEQALRAFRAGNMSVAVSSWDRGFEIANRHFDRGDPRQAASYTNQAFALMRQQQLLQAQLMLQDAIRRWDDSWRWIPLMVPRPGDNQCEATCYDEPIQQEFYAFVRRGQAITEALAQERQLPTGGLEEWRDHRPATMCDLRKLISAVLLIASKKA